MKTIWKLLCRRLPLLRDLAFDHRDRTWRLGAHGSRVPHRRASAFFSF